MDLAYELHDLVRTLDREAERILRPEGLSYHRYVALIVIAEHPGVTGRQLSGALGVTEAAVSGIVRALIRDGSVDNVAEAGTGNVRHLRITAQGETLRQRCATLLGSSLDNNARAIQIDPAALARTIRSLHDELRSTHRSTDSEKREP
ncbi:MarR family winged helix-turn-helix transcriptional regulator [Micropruina sp.]|uniref:MarR family winged helix-turn-helix transcriptional regulator n=1 Tax=Micropruina sp. TaxID=2737536 RepID=UPI0039E40B4D